MSSCQALFKRNQRSGVIAGIQPGVSHFFESEHKIALVLNGRASPPLGITLFEVSTRRWDQALRCLRGAGSIAVVLCNKPAPNAQALLVKCDCSSIVAFSLPKIADPLERDAEVPLQFFVVLVAASKATADSKTIRVSGKCPNWIAVTDAEVCKLLQIRQQVTLILRTSGVGSGQPAGDGETFLDSR